MINRLINDPFYVGYDEMSLKQSEAYITCQIVDTGVIIHPVQYAYAIQKYSPFYQAFHYHMSKIKETGTRQRYLEYYKAKDQMCADYSGVPISRGQCFSVFIVLIVAVCGSILCLG